MQLTIETTCAMSERSHAPRRAPWWRLLSPATASLRFDATHDHEAFGVEGDCLRPYLLPGDLVYVDRQLAPLDGELVLVDMRYRKSSSLVGAGAPVITRRALKQYFADDEGGALCSADGAVHARAHRILGVVTIVQRRPSWRAWRCIRAPLRRMNFRPVE